MAINDKANWFMTLIGSIQALAEELGLDDVSSQKLREFVLNTAKSQFKAGNSSGIYWARKNPPKDTVAAAV